MTDTEQQIDLEEIVADATVPLPAPAPVVEVAAETIPHTKRTSGYRRLQSRHNNLII